MFRVVHRKLEFIIHMKRNWTYEQSVVTLLVTLKNPKGLGFTVLIIVRELWKPVMPDSLKMVKSVGVIIYEI
jgi:hypothetical protein